MGAAAGELLSALNPDENWVGMPYGAVIDARFEGIRCRATRVSYVGEYGCEIMVPNHGAGQLFDALIASGARPMGHFALDGCRLEKGFRHWGHDITPTVTPLEAGLGFTIDWNKDFVGKPVLERQRKEGSRRRLVLLQVEGDVLLLHDEPVFEAGCPVGLTTSGARGPRTGLNLCLAMVQIQPRETLAQTCARQFTLQVAGQDYPATPLRRPPFDPSGERMRP